MHRTDEEVLNAVSWCSGAARRAEAMEAPKSSAHQARAQLLPWKGTSLAAVTWGIAAPALNNAPCPRQQLQDCWYIKWHPSNALWVFWYSPLSKELNKKKFTDKAAAH